ncbi:MAG TPA: hypothetical protein VK138_16640 [Acidiferrobacterales bacterium]|nr:hypothetical protein [Acidiferrobacterales bacterium]
MAMALARRVGGYDLQTLAETFNVSHYSTIAVAVSRLRSRSQRDGQLAARWAQLTQQLG